MPRPIRLVKTYGAAAAQSTRTEILAGEGANEWAQCPPDEILVIEKLGVYAATTCTLGLIKGREIIIPEGSAMDGTSFGGDWEKVASVNLTLKPMEALLCYIIDSAADPAGVTFAVKGWSFKTSELVRRK